MNENLQFNGVLINKQKDPRDYNISMFIPGEDIIRDSEFCLKLPKLDIILNQNQFNACVGHSFAIAKSILEYNRTNKYSDIWIIFKINEKQAKILKTLDGYLGKGVNIHYLDINFKKGTQPKSKAFEKVENTLKMIGNSEKLLRLMNFDNDSLFDDSYCYLNEVK